MTAKKKHATPKARTQDILRNYGWNRNAKTAGAAKPTAKRGKG
jgi:hypothetical protein